MMSMCAQKSAIWCDDDMMWDAAKLDAAMYVFSKEKRANIFRRLWKSKSYNYLSDAEKPSSEQEFRAAVRECPLISSPPSVRKERKVGRKIAVCEKNEKDRALVYQSLKYYRQSAFIDEHIVPVQKFCKLDIPKETYKE